MMVSFMRYCKNSKPHLFFLSALLLCIPLVLSADVYAEGSNLQIKLAELVPIEGAYALNADFDVNFSSDVEVALNKSVPLSFLIEFQITSPQRYWFDDEIVSASMRVSLSYHALSRQYLIKRGAHQQTFATLQEAKDELAQLHGWKVVDKSLLKKGEIYNAALRIRLDQSRLPKPLQVDALNSEDWAMVSERYLWIPAFAF